MGDERGLIWQSHKISLGIKKLDHRVKMDQEWKPIDVKAAPSNGQSPVYSIVVKMQKH
jgi:hypothetical protein